MDTRKYNIMLVKYLKYNNNDNYNDFISRVSARFGSTYTKIFLEWIHYYVSGTI